MSTLITQRVDLSRPSCFETTLIQGGPVLIRSFFDSWPSPSIFVLSTSSFFMWSIIREYMSLRWNLRATLSKWFNSNNIDGLVDVLRDTGALICGPMVAQFFNRSSTFTDNLDICVEKKKYGRVMDFLTSQLYSYPRSPRLISTFSPAVQSNVHTYSLRNIHRSRGTVTVHVVHGDPLTFMLTYATSEYRRTPPPQLGHND